MRLCLVFSVTAVLALGACSSPAPPERAPAASASASPQPASAPANPTLGSPAWYAWVSRSVGIDTQSGPAPGSSAWQHEVQTRLGHEAPSSTPGTPQWQQAVDALLRTRLPAAAASAP